MSDTPIHTPAEAWDDFWKWIKEQPQWAEANRAERQYLDKTNRQVKEGKVGVRRLRRIFNDYAPGRYEYSGGFIFREK